MAVLFQINVPTSFACTLDRDDEQAVESLKSLDPLNLLHYKHWTKGRQIRLTSADSLVCRNEEGWKPKDEATDESRCPRPSYLLINPEDVIHDFLKEQNIETYYAGAHTGFAQCEQVSLFKGADVDFEIVGSNCTGAVYGTTVAEAKEMQEKKKKNAIIKEREKTTEYRWFQFIVETEEAEYLTQRLIQLGIGVEEGFGSICVFPLQSVSVSRPVQVENSFADANPIESERKANKSLEKFRRTIKSRLAIDSILSDVQNGAEMTFDYVCFLLVAAIIAEVGLTTNSSVIIVASMLVSPLMGPILGITFGTVLNDKKLLRTGLWTAASSIFICVLVGFVGGLISVPFLFVTPGLRWPTEEMCSRVTAQGFFNGFWIAVPSGVGVALSVLGGNMGGLVGVAISASLLPPAVNAGLVLSMGLLFIYLHANRVFDCTMKQEITFSWSELSEEERTDVYQLLWSAAGWSLGLTLMNILVIYLTGLIMFKVKSVSPSGENAQFWKQDIQYVRKYNRMIEDNDNNELFEDVDEGYGMLGKLFEEEGIPQRADGLQDVEAQDKQAKPKLRRAKAAFRSDMKRFVETLRENQAKGKPKVV